MTPFYHKRRVYRNQFLTMVGMTDHVPDHAMAEATEQLQRDMGAVLSKFNDPDPIIGCVLAYFFLERQAPITLSEKDRNDIDKMFETFMRFYEEDWQTGQYREALKVSVESFEEMRKELSDDIMHRISVEDRAMNMVRKVVGYRRFRAWSANPKRNPGRRPEWERVREEDREDSSYDYLILRVHKKKKKDIARLVRPPFVTNFFHADSFLALGLAYELASISRESSGVPCDHLCQNLFLWVFNAIPKDYQAFRESSEKVDFDQFKFSIE